MQNAISSTREVTTLPLSQAHISKLIENGFVFVKDLQDIKPLELQKELSIPLEEAQAIIGTVQQSKEEIKIQSAKDIILKRNVGRPIITFCKEVDSMLFGGIPVGQLTEICGIPGVGKTQMAMQLAVDAQIPEVFGGNGGEAIYIDTEGSFMVERAAEMAAAVSNHLGKISKSRKMEQKSRELGIDLPAAAAAMSMNRFLEGINVYRVHDQTELLALFDQLTGILSLNSRIRLIVIDSIAFHFRQSLQDTAQRSRILGTVSQQLHQIANNFSIAILVVNHMTTKIDAHSTTLLSMPANASVGLAAPGSSSSVVPALGDVWSHCITNRILLSWQSDNRIATIVKSPAWPNATASFIINASGIRDLPTIPENNENGSKKRKADIPA